MIPVVQQIVGDGKDKRPMGDCLRACLASIFELPLEEVPHVAASPRGWWSATQDWLRPRGLWMETLEYTVPSEKPIPKGERYPAGWWIAVVDSQLFEGATHAVVMRGLYVDGTSDPHLVVHDPSPVPRQVPYVFHGARWFTVLDPALAIRRP